jgi:hypothetical protein
MLPPSESEIWPAEANNVSCPTAVVYATTEEARLLLMADAELGAAGNAVSEAAYYLSDAMDPDQRAELLATAERRIENAGDRDDDTEMCAVQALALLTDAAGEVESLVRGPSASAELHIGLRALRRAIADLAQRLGLETDLLHAGALRGRLVVLLGMRPRE